MVILNFASLAAIAAACVMPAPGSLQAKCTATMIADRMQWLDTRLLGH